MGELAFRKICILLLVPVTLFIASLFIRPAMNDDSAVGFIAFRSMLEGGSFNNVTAPDTTNIANDVTSFLTLWSPGQYLVPGIFVWFGTDYGLAILLTTLIATTIGVVGWAQVARSFDVSCFVLFLFMVGLVTFHYVTFPFRVYYGGELLLFAVSPWSLYALRWVADKPPAFCLAISVLSAALLFFAKLSGLVVFAANVAAISLLVVVTRRRLTSSLVAIWVGSGIAALLFLTLWLPRGEVAASVSGFAWLFFAKLTALVVFAANVAAISLLVVVTRRRLTSSPLAISVASGIAAAMFLTALWLPRAEVPLSGVAFAWLAIWFPVASAAFSGIAGLDFLRWLFLRPSAPIRSDLVVLSYVGGLLGLLLMVLVWFRLRNTRYRPMAFFLFSIIALYTAALVALYLLGSTFSFEERHFRYAGILFFLLLLVAVDQWRAPLAKVVSILTVGASAAYGLASYANDAAHKLMLGRHYDSASGTSMQMMTYRMFRTIR
jgi:hypothetical protein